MSPAEKELALTVLESGKGELALPVSQFPVVHRPADPYLGIASRPFAKEVADILMLAVDAVDVEIRPDGILYLPEIKYRLRLNRAFGPGGWAMMPRSPFTSMESTLTREYALYAEGRFISEARGEQEYIEDNDNMTWATATEGVKSNAIMRCCKDIGIAWELWDPGYREQWTRDYAVQVWRREAKNKKPQWRRKDREPFWDESGYVNGAPAPAAPPPPKRRAVIPPIPPEQKLKVVKVPPEQSKLHPPVEPMDLQAPDPAGEVFTIVGFGDPDARGRMGVRCVWEDDSEGWANVWSKTEQELLRNKVLGAKQSAKAAGLDPRGAGAAFVGKVKRTPIPDPRTGGPTEWVDLSDLTEVSIGS